jgi:hypothetical protein
MTPLEFAEMYEAKGMELHLLTLVKDALTPKGKEVYGHIESWLTKNANRYYEAPDKLGRDTLHE